MGIGAAADEEGGEVGMAVLGGDEEGGAAGGVAGVYANVGWIVVAVDAVGCG